MVELLRKTPIDTILLADSHIGAQHSTALVIPDLLSKYDYERFFDLGDTTDSLWEEELTYEEKEVLTFYRRLTRLGKRVRRTKGNHDIAKIEDYETTNTISWWVNNKKFIAIHGHQFDDKIMKNPSLDRLANLIYRWGRKFGTNNFIQRLAYKNENLSQKIAQNVAKLAKKRGAQTAFFGHTHELFHKNIDGVECMNPASFVEPDKPPHLILITSSAEVVLEPVQI